MGHWFESSSRSGRIMRISLFFSIVYVVLATSFLSGCLPAIIAGTAATAGVVGYHASKTGSFKAQFRNLYLEGCIHGIWEESELDEPFLDVVCVHGVPVIFGAATSKAGLEKARALAFIKADDVVVLADGVQMGSWNTGLACKIKTRLIMSEIRARNYYVAAIRNIVWVLGVAATNAEKKQVLEIVSGMNGVETVRHHIIIVDEHNNDGYMVRE